jgi:hypothetical protein
MISGLWFVLKTFLFSVLVLILLQAKFGNKTLEERTTLWVQQSNLVAPLENFANQTARWIKSEKKEFNASAVLDSFKKMFMGLFARSEEVLKGMAPSAEPASSKKITPNKKSQEKINEEEPEKIEKAPTPQSSTFKWG